MGSSDKILEPTSKELKQCKKCKFRSTIQGSVICYYICYENKRRPCPMGELCTVFEEGPPGKLSDPKHLYSDIAKSSELNKYLYNLKFSS